MDTADHVWSVPATRTKAKREHRVPLCRRAERILDAARTLSKGRREAYQARSLHPKCGPEG